MLKRGDIHYILKGAVTGSEQKAGRPAIIVSNDSCNVSSEVIEVVFLTTRPKKDLPTHVTVRNIPRISTAICEQITSVSKERIGDYVGYCTESEITQIDIALRHSLALAAPQKSLLKPAPVENTELVNDLRMRLSEALKEKDVYKEMYDRLVESILNRRT